jgi:aspartyl aminopeptidase
LDRVSHATKREVSEASPAEEASKLLAKAGYQRLSETSEWKLEVGGRYYFTRNLSTLVAFAVGSEYKAGNGFHLVGAHTDR